MLDDFASSSRLLAGRSRTAPIVAELRKILMDCVETKLPGTPLPSLRDMAAAFGTSVAPVQRAVRELTAAGVLVSRPKSGVFVAVGAGDPAGERPTASAAPGLRIRFATESANRWQRVWWADLAREFNRQTLGESLELHFMPSGRADTVAYDVREITNSEWRFPDDELQPLHASEIPVFERLPRRVFRDRGVRLYTRTMWLFVNCELLRKSLVPLPDYDSFDGQCAYLDRVARRFPPPFSVYFPSTFLGGDFYGESAAAQGKRLRRLEAFYTRTRLGEEYDGTSEFRIQGDFFTGVTPLHFGGSWEYWRYRRDDFLHFEWRAFPVYIADGDRLRYPVYAGLHRDCACPINALRVLEFLLGDAAQARFADSGALPIAESDGHPLYEFADPEQNYIDKNIVNPELFKAATGRISWAAAWENAARLADFYRRCRR